MTFEAGFDTGEFEASNAIDLEQCSASPPAALIFHSPADTTVNFETFATLESDDYKEANECEDVSSVSSLNSNCTKFASGNARVVFGDPACRVDIDGDGVCTEDQHSIWNITEATGKRQGPEAMKSFLQRFY